jgi:beta-lactamase regulating signal transducer with metallopeptidase domain
MFDFADRMVDFLALVSIQLLILGLTAGVIVFLIRIRGTAGYWLFGLIILSPFLVLCSMAIPPEIKFPIQWAEKPANQPAPVKAVAPVYAYVRNAPAQERSQPIAELWKAASAHWKRVLIAAWGAIVALLLIRLLRKFRIIVQALRVLKDTDEPEIRRLLEECANRAGLKRVPRLAAVGVSNSPLVVGFLSPTIVIPEHLLLLENREGLRFTLLHEMTHLRRKDDWWLIPELLCKTLFFFHPAVHWASRRLHDELEFLCDRAVIEITRQRASYADFLLQESWKNVSRTQRAFSLPFASRSCATSRRVRHILSQKGVTFMDSIRNTVAVSLVALIAVASFLFTTAPRAVGQAAAPAIDGSTSAPQAEPSGQAPSTEPRYFYYWTSNSVPSATDVANMQAQGFQFGGVLSGLPQSASDAQSANFHTGYIHFVSPVPPNNAQFGMMGGMGGMGMGYGASQSVPGGQGGGGGGMMGGGGFGMVGVPSPSTGAASSMGGGMSSSRGGMGGGAGGGGYGRVTSSSAGATSSMGGMGMMGGGVGSMIGSSQSVFQLDPRIDLNTLDIRVNNNIAERGVDYLLDEKQNTIVFLNQDDKTRRVQINYLFKSGSDSTSGAAEGASTSSQNDESTNNSQSDTQQR